MSVDQSPVSGSVPSPGAPSSPGEAIAMMLTALTWLAGADLASAPSATQAECLRGLERAQSAHAAARANALRAFAVQGGYEDDGVGSPRTWLTWQTRITRPAANAALSSMRTLADHPRGRRGARRGRHLGVVGAAGDRVDRDAARGVPR